MPVRNTPADFLMLNDKIMHTAEYFILGILTFRYFSVVLGKNPAVSNILTIFSAGLFGIIDEVHQGMIGYFDKGVFGSVRDPDIFDFMADLFGVGFSLAMLYVIMYRRTRNINKRTGTK